MIRALGWSGEVLPPCPVGDCSLRAMWLIRIPVRLARTGEPWSRMATRCQVHGREWAERHDLRFPPDEEARDAAPHAEQQPSGGRRVPKSAMTSSARTSTSTCGTRGSSLRR
jgi:hypothetical protein